MVHQKIFPPNLCRQGKKPPHFIAGLFVPAESIRRVEKIVGKKIASYSVDLLDKAALEDIFKKVSGFPSALDSCIFSVISACLSD